MTALAEWTPTTGRPPEVCVGIVLPQDGATVLRLVLPDAPYNLAGDVEAVRSLLASAVECQVDGTGVRLRIDDREFGTAQSWTLAPCSCAEGAQRPVICVDGVVVGRGFHWESWIKQLLPGGLTVRHVDGHLLLACRLPLEEYLVGVITSEMSGDCPVEFMKAQCIVARSWTLAAAERKHANLDIDLCNDDCCQRYQGIRGATNPARSAVKQTRGLVLIAENRTVVDANYSKCCGGIVEAPEYVWGRPKPGLTALVDGPSSSVFQRFWPVDASNIDAYLAADELAECDVYCSPASVSEADLGRYLGRVDRGSGFFRWSVAYQRTELEGILREKGFAPPDFAELVDIKVTRRGGSGRATKIDLAYRDANGRRATVTISDQYRIRQALHERFLFSSAFRVRVEREGDGRATRFHLDGSGWGHGAGMCQIGALGMALAGSDHRAILSHYFPTARLQSVYA